jgi:hypothetical protein
MCSAVSFPPPHLYLPFPSPQSWPTQAPPRPPCPRVQPSPPFPPLQSRRLVFWGTSFRHRLNTTDLHQILVGAPSRSGPPSGSESSGRRIELWSPAARRRRRQGLGLLLLSWGSVDVLVCRLRLILFSSCNIFFLVLFWTPPCKLVSPAPHFALYKGLFNRPFVENNK